MNIIKDDYELDANFFKMYSCTQQLYYSVVAFYIQYFISNCLHLWQKVHDEPAPKNPYLAKFYKEPKKYALKLQLWLFQQRFLMYVQSLKHIMKTGELIFFSSAVSLHIL